MPDIPTTEPTTFTRGDTVKWTKSISDFPASVWLLTYELRGPSSQTIQATASGDDHAIVILASATTLWNAGTYFWKSNAFSGAMSERYTVASGEIIVTKSFVERDVKYDGRTHAKIVLDAIEATIEGRATRDQQAYTIAGRSLQLTPIADLLMLRTRYRAEVKAEQSKGKKKRILVRLG